MGAVNLEAKFKQFLKKLRFIIS